MGLQVVSPLITPVVVPLQSPLRSLDERSTASLALALEGLMGGSGLGFDLGNSKWVDIWDKRGCYLG